jgi:hut operon positive regulator
VEERDEEERTDAERILEGRTLEGKNSEERIPEDRERERESRTNTSFFEAAQDVKEGKEAQEEKKEEGKKEEEKKEDRHSLTSFKLGPNDVARAALLVALTKDTEMESIFKQEIELWGWRVVATEVGGLLNDLPPKLVRAIVGASLNAGVIEKNSREMHSLVHAAIEAGDSFVHRGILEISMGAKIVIVRNDQWVAVAIFGDCAVHATAHHDRCGLGVMHI